MLWRHPVDRHGRLSFFFIKIALHKFFIILRWTDGALVVNHATKNILNKKNKLLRRTGIITFESEFGLRYDIGHLMFVIDIRQILKSFGLFGFMN